MRPSVPPPRGRTRVDTLTAIVLPVLPVVLEDVAERIADLARRRQLPRMVAITPDRTTATEDAVDGFGDANGQALHTASQCRRRVSLDDEMHVVSLHRKRDDAEDGVRRAGQGSANHVEHGWSAQGDRKSGRA
jgi:hypothetical protein